VSERLPPPTRRRVAGTAPAAGEVAVLGAGTQVLRVHPLGGRHPSAWDEFRAFGPTGARFDHHPPPPRRHPNRAVMYVTVGRAAFIAAVAEFFQDDGGTVAPLERTLRRPAATAFTLAAPLRLLDLRSGWVTRAGGNQAIMSGARSRSRAWARAIFAAHRDLDGLLYTSSVWGPGTCAVLWERAVAAIPAGNDLHRSLADAAMDVPLAVAAEQLGTVLLD
jgi:hypothetical protein